MRKRKDLYRKQRRANRDYIILYGSMEPQPLLFGAPPRSLWESNVLDTFEPRPLSLETILEAIRIATIRFGEAPGAKQ